MDAAVESAHVPRGLIQSCLLSFVFANLSRRCICCATGNRVSFFIRSQRSCPRDRLLSSRLKKAFHNAGDLLLHDLEIFIIAIATFLPGVGKVAAMSHYPHSLVRLSACHRGVAETTSIHAQAEASILPARGLDSACPGDWQRTCDMDD